MVKVVAKNFIKADRMNEFIETAEMLVRETVQNDTGCIRYELFQDLSNPQVLTIIEEWEDQSSLDAHMTAKHFKEATTRFPEFAEKPGEINLYKKLA